MAKIKNTVASPNNSKFWNGKSSMFLVDMITLMRMSNVKNVNYSTN